MNEEQDTRYMARCIALAEQGRGFTAPNPMVGAVLVANGDAIGEGYHETFGGPHAEVHAINSVKDRELLKNSTLYVNLEPCCHFGKTPPCTDLILKSGITRVVFGTSDPFPSVSGSGKQILTENKIDVVDGILKEECLELNKRFFRFHLSKRPYIILKWAQTADGLIAKSDFNSKMAQYPTIERAKASVHPFWKQHFPTDPKQISVKVVDQIAD